MNIKSLNMLRNNFHLFINYAEICDNIANYKMNFLYFIMFKLSICTFQSICIFITFCICHWNTGNMCNVHLYINWFPKHKGIQHLKFKFVLPSIQFLQWTLHTCTQSLNCTLHLQNLRNVKRFKCSFLIYFYRCFLV